MTMHMNRPAGGFEVRRATRASRVAVIVLLILALAVASAPWWAGRDAMRDFVQLASYLVFVSMFHFLFLSWKKRQKKAVWRRACTKPGRFRHWC